MLIDVRPRIQFGICRLPNSVNIPIDELDKHLAQIQQQQQDRDGT